MDVSNLFKTNMVQTTMPACECSAGFRCMAVFSTNEESSNKNVVRSKQRESGCVAEGASNEPKVCTWMHLSSGQYCMACMTRM